MTQDPIEAMAEAMNKRVPLSPTTRRDLAAVALAAYRETDEFKGLVSERDRLKLFVEKVSAIICEKHTNGSLRQWMILFQREAEQALRSEP